MKSTIEIANLLNDSVDVLSKQSKPFETNLTLKKYFHDIGVNLSFIAINNGNENSKREIEQKLKEVSDAVSALLLYVQIRASADITKTLSQIQDWILEYRKALDAPRESYESKAARIQQLNKQFRAFQYKESTSIGVFAHKDEDADKSKDDAKNPNDKLFKNNHAKVNGHPRKEAVLQPISVGPTTKNSQ